MRFDFSALEKESKEIRKTIISTADYVHGRVHWGGSLSCVEILNSIYTVLLEEKTDLDLRSINDSVVVSKGHAALALYSVLYQKKLIPAFIYEYQKDGSKYCEEITLDSSLGINCSTGSLGLGLPFAVGKALKSKRNNENQRFYVLMGDGECDEGSVWETVMFAAHHKLNNLCVIIDRNKLQLDGETERIVNKNNLCSVFNAFGWEINEVNGHSYSELFTALVEKKEKPYVIIANTIKGKGVSFMENNYIWHDKMLNNDLLSLAKKEVGFLDA